MKRLLCGATLLLAAGCGSDGNVRSVTPVMADTRGTYRLAALSETRSDPGRSASSLSSSGGTLRLADATYSRSVVSEGGGESQGIYLIGSSVNTMLINRHGSFSLTTPQPPYLLTGTFEVVPDFTLTLNYHQYALPDQTLVTRTETWIKESDYPRF